MKMKFTFVVAAAVFAFTAASVNAQIFMSGSSAIFLEMGQASLASSAGANTQCGWSDGGSQSKHFTLTDTRPSELTPAGANLTDTGNQAWVTWQVASGANCTTAAIIAGTVNVFVNVDSGVGDRCFFANPSCEITTTATGGEADGGLIGTTGHPASALNANVVTLMTAPAFLSINAAASDVRPEDANFQMLRGFKSCGTPMVAGSQYLGIGYQTAPQADEAGLVGQQIHFGAGSSNVKAGAGGPFNLAAWNMTGSDPFNAAKAVPAFTVIPVGAVPVVVFVNPQNESGFGSLQVSNIDHGVLASYIDGSLQRVVDPLTQGYGASSAYSVTYIREFLSGTYTTMEFNIPNSQANQSSTDVGLAALNSFNAGLNPYPPFECASVGGITSTAPGAGINDLGAGTPNPYRVRTIGTGNMTAEVYGQKDALGYAFWSSANFAGSSATTAKYLTVDGVDPIQEVWSDGLLPTSGNGTLGNVSLSHVKDGSYPIWSIVRVLCTPSTTPCTDLATLVTFAQSQSFVNFSQPDFVPAGTLQVVRSHFSPPTVNYPASAANANGSTPANTPSNGNPAAASTESGENGGDAGGVVYTLQAVGDFAVDSGNAVGEVGHRN